MPLKIGVSSPPEHSVQVSKKRSNIGGVAEFMKLIPIERFLNFDFVNQFFKRYLAY